MAAIDVRPRVGVSSCLLGERVRYDGRDKRDAFVCDVLARFVEWVPACPEVEAGMGVPRPPIDLVRIASAGGEVRVVVQPTGEDVTRAMDAWIGERVRALLKQLDGYVFKARSPSCGVRDVPIRGRGEPIELGSGRFAEALVRAAPALAVADEEMLSDASGRVRFVDAIFESARARAARQGSARWLEAWAAAHASARDAALEG